MQNRVYDGEFEPDTDYTQTQLKTALQSGEFVFHNVSGEVRVLDDINTMVTTTDTQEMYSKIIRLSGSLIR